MAATNLLKAQVDAGGIVVALICPEQIAFGSHVPELLSWLDAREQATYDRFRFAIDRRAYLAAHALARAMLGACSGLPPQDLLIHKNRWGRPELQGLEEEREIYFSITHTRGLVACAVCRCKEIGIDIENFDRADSDALLTSEIFTPEEICEIKSASFPARGRVFFSYWTLKEAYSKACGLGLGLPFASFEFKLVDGVPPQIEFPDSVANDPAKWSFWLNEVEPSYLLALASGRPHPQRVFLYRWQLPGSLTASGFHEIESWTS